MNYGEIQCTMATCDWYIFAEPVTSFTCIVITSYYAIYITPLTDQLSFHTQVSVMVWL